MVQYTRFLLFSAPNNPALLTLCDQTGGTSQTQGCCVSASLRLDSEFTPSSVRQDVMLQRPAQPVQEDAQGNIAGLQFMHGKKIYLKMTWIKKKEAHDPMHAQVPSLEPSLH